MKLNQRQIIKFNHLQSLCEKQLEEPSIDFLEELKDTNEEYSQAKTTIRNYLDALRDVE